MPARKETDYGSEKRMLGQSFCIKGEMRLKTGSHPLHKVIVASTIVLVFCLFWNATEAKSPPMSFAYLASRLLPSVGNISTTQTVDARRGVGPNIPKFPPGSPFEEFFKDFLERHPPGGKDKPNQRRAPRRAQSLGSGFIIDRKGIVVTNNHVIAGADEIKVRLQDDTEFKAKILGRDPKIDIAVLKIEPGDTKLTAVSFGDSDKLRVGDWVVAIGNPFGLGGTVTAGIVSARGRDINQGPYDDFIQTDASINKGNSGGPLFDLDGKVIGINTAIFSQSGGSVGIGFAVASRLAEPVVTQLKDYGRTRRGWLGVRIQMVTEEIAESFGLQDPSGALVAEVTKDGPAARAGIRPGDVILAFNGQAVETMRRLPRIVAETPIGIDVPVKIWRGGKIKRVTARIGELEKAEASGVIPAVKKERNPKKKTERIEEIGFELSSITPSVRSKYSIPSNVNGVIIIAVDRGGAAADKDLRPGDVVVELGQKRVKNLSEFSKIFDSIVRKKRKKSVLLTINRQGSIQFVGVRLRKE